MNTNYLQGDLSFDDLLYLSADEKEYYYDDVALTGLTAGQTVTVTLGSPSLGSRLFAPVLELRRADDLRQVLKKSQTGQEATQLTFIVKPGRNYVMRVTSLTPQDIGTYTLTASAGNLKPVPKYQAEAIAQQGQYRWQPDSLGQPITLTYSFMEELPSYYRPDRQGRWDYGTSAAFKPMNEVQREAAQLALREWEKVSGITFKAVDDSDSVQLRFGTARDLSQSASGWAYLPDKALPPNPKDGDVWINRQGLTDRGLKPGAFDFHTVLHEIGHAIGLSHPFDDAATLPKAEQTLRHTVMAYDPHPFLPWYHYPRTPMLYDIAAVQWLYSRNTSTGKGNTVYRWQAGETFIETIYDVSGRDTVNARNQTEEVVIDLTPGKFSSIGQLRGEPIQDNVAIAFGVTIEDAIGGSGNDILTGNQVNNELMGGWGADRLTGLAGNDRLTGGRGADTFVFQTLEDGVDRITDFTQDKDTIEVSRLLEQVGYDGTDPFLDGFLSVSVQRKNTIVSFDQDGWGGTASAVPLVILENFIGLQRLSTAIRSFPERLLL